MLERKVRSRKSSFLSIEKYFFFAVQIPSNLMILWANTTTSMRVFYKIKWLWKISTQNTLKIMLTSHHIHKQSIFSQNYGFSEEMSEWNELSKSTLDSVWKNVYRTLLLSRVIMKLINRILIQIWSFPKEMNRGVVRKRWHADSATNFLVVGNFRLIQPFSRHFTPSVGKTENCFHDYFLA